MLIQMASVMQIILLTNLFNFSHHKLTVFEFADGVNEVKINDEFITNYTTNRTDLTMYYEKVGLAYGQSSGRAIEPDYPSTSIDIQTKVDEYRIVGQEVHLQELVVFTRRRNNADTHYCYFRQCYQQMMQILLSVFLVFLLLVMMVFVVSERPVVYCVVQNTPTTAAPTATGATLTLSLIL